MFRQLAIVLGLCLCAGAGPGLSMEIADMTQICEGQAEGTSVPHPYDCGAYFVCNTIPSINFCMEGLHFDADHRVCDLPQKANCIRLESPAVATPPSMEAITPFTHNNWNQKPKPAFIAVDVVSGESVDPMYKYDPQQIECRHFGAYFLPHPRNCHQYFICAYGHLHRHHCGIGTHWNYKRSECQVSEFAECYSTEHGILVDSEPETEIPMSPTTSVLPTTSVSLGNPVTVCYIVEGGSTVLSTVNGDDTSSMAPPPSTPRVEPNALNCPADHQSYLPHPDDCNRYYICIAGRPVLTSCPQGLYWDQKSGYCDEAKYVKCFQSA